MIDHFIVFGKPVISERAMEEVLSCLRCGWLGTGSRVHEFEHRFAEYKGVGGAVALSSCTAGLFLALRTLHIQPGDEVIVPTMTFVSTANVVEHIGARPVLVDCDPRTFNVLPAEIEQKINSRTRAIMIVHFAGRACEMDRITEISRRHDIPLIEDCAHAVETRWKGYHAGTFGDYGCFSFYANKNITTGEGGMILAKKGETLERIRKLSLHGLSRDAWKRFSDSGYQHYFVDEPGYKFNMMDIQAAIGIHQLEDVEWMHRRRREIWNRYSESFRDLPFQLPMDEAPETVHGFHLYTPLLLTENVRFSRDQLLKYLSSNNIGCGVHYIPVHQHLYYKKTYALTDSGFPNASCISARTFSLPLTPYLTDEEVEAIIESVKRAFDEIMP